MKRQPVQQKVPKQKEQQSKQVSERQKRQAPVLDQSGSGTLKATLSRQNRPAQKEGKVKERAKRDTTSSVTHAPVRTRKQLTAPGGLGVYRPGIPSHQPPLLIPETPHRSAPDNLVQGLVESVASLKGQIGRLLKAQEEPKAEDSTGSRGARSRAQATWEADGLTDKGKTRSPAKARQKADGPVGLPRARSRTRSGAQEKREADGLMGQGRTRSLAKKKHEIDGSMGQQALSEAQLHMEPGDLTKEADDLTEEPDDQSSPGTPAKLYPESAFLELWDRPSTIPPTLDEKIFANKFFVRRPVKLLFTAGSLHQVTLTDVPEVAFVGRSNSGKSSLVNALLGDNVARTSAKLGKTQTLNGWAVGGMDKTGSKHKLTVLDMPGYGHGSRPEWGKTITKYLTQRKELKRVFVLINPAHGYKDHDKQMVAALREAAIPHQIVMSKIDEFIWPAGKKKKTDKRVGIIQKVTGTRNMRMVRSRVRTLADSVLKQKPGGLPTSKDVLCCSGESEVIPTGPPDPPGTLGISALRWSVLNVAGLQPTGKVKDQKDFSF